LKYAKCSYLVSGISASVSPASAARTSHKYFQDHFIAEFAEVDAEIAAIETIKLIRDPIFEMIE
jgi:hypothetical protein